jgi:CRP-like cAMP-binding protein/Fe-S-cluster-containing hydrogenase component 2
MEIGHKTLAQLVEELQQIPFFEDLKPELLLQRVPLLEDLPPKLAGRVVQEAEILSFSAGQVICKQGDYEDVFYLILAGEVEVTTYSQAHARIALGTIGPGDFFGEMGPLSGQPRTATITARERTIVLAFPKEIFHILHKGETKLKHAIDRKYIERSLRTHLRQVSIFTALSDQDLDDLVSRIKLKSFKKGEVIIRQGDEGDSLYLVRAGFVKVSLGELAHEKILTYLREGSYFGEAALVRGEKRNANVVAMTPVEAVQILKADVGHILAKNPRIAEEFERAVSDRAKETQEVLHDESKARAISFVVKQGLAQAREVLVIDQTRCLECDLCVESCRAVHGHSRLIRRGSRLGRILVPTSCFHCENPECLLCPFGGIVRDKQGEIHHTEACNGCGGCARRCPYGNILIVKDTDASGQEKQRVVKCDMCVDFPRVACVYNCPVAAAHLLRPEEIISQHQDSPTADEH